MVSDTDFVNGIKKCTYCGPQYIMCQNILRDCYKKSKATAVYLFILFFITTSHDDHV